MAATTAAPALAAQVAKGGNWPNDFNRREQRLLQSVKTYVDAQTGGAAVITTQGDLIIGDASGDPVRLARGTSGQVLVGNGTTASWASIGLASLAAGITPSHIVKFAGTVAVTSAQTSQALAIAGVASTDIVLVQMRAADTNAVSIKSAVPTTDTVTVAYSASTGTGGTLQYQVLRAAS